MRWMSEYPAVEAASNRGRSVANLPLFAAQANTRSSQAIGAPSEYVAAGAMEYCTVRVSPGTTDTVPMSLSDNASPSVRGS